MSNIKFRSLHATDLDRVAEIDSRIAGKPRRGFHEKRLVVATATPESFVTCAALDGDKLLGYGFARIQEGEFGVVGAVAVLDAIGVDPDSQGKGVGKAVIAEIERLLKKKEIGTLRTQVVWADCRMISFFSSARFNLASIQIIERDTSPLPEEVAVLNPVHMDGRWQVHSGNGGNYWDVHSGNGGNHYEKLSRDRVMVRSLKKEDLSAIVRIDAKLTARDRSDYYETKFREMLIESGIRISLVAEDSGIVNGFVMARVDFGEFGKVDRTAVLDTIGIHPAYKGSGIGHALLSQLLINLSALQVETVRTQVSWKNFELQRFLHGCGFGPSQRLVLTKAVS
jgi:ribosomal protein S18 acetylase RimI-like enzyme